MALMAGILFTATFLVFGISTFVSPARIYPPNEGKVVGRTKKKLPRTSDFIPRLRGPVCVCCGDSVLVASGLILDNTDGHLYAATFCELYVNRRRSGFPNAQRLVGSRLGLWSSREPGEQKCLQPRYVLISLFGEKVKLLYAYNIS